MIVPLPGADGPIGVIAFGLRGTERAYEHEDRSLAEEIARRVAPAVENALRYEQQSATAEALQRSLLPDGARAVRRAWSSRRGTCPAPTASASGATGTTRCRCRRAG